MNPMIEERKVECEICGQRTKVTMYGTTTQSRKIRTIDSKDSCIKGSPRTLRGFYQQRATMLFPIRFVWTGRSCLCHPSTCPLARKVDNVVTAGDIQQGCYRNVWQVPGISIKLTIIRMAYLQRKALLFNTYRKVHPKEKLTPEVTPG